MMSYGPPQDTFDDKRNLFLQVMQVVGEGMDILPHDGSTNKNGCSPNRNECKKRQSTGQQNTHNYIDLLHTVTYD